jgi:two-component sensor histidine kinase
MAIVLHELVTNASKYGALTKPHGRIAVRWTLQRDGDGRRILVLEWVETGGPTVVVPDQPGYGTGAIRNLIPYELSGRVDLAFDAAGVRCRIELPAKRSREGTETIDLFKVPVPLQAPAQSEAQSP